ncbi:1104_t:CDS:10 [Racocetra fulgida]|uniref:1104_t:CDS:1 n=1 Tax=Racocetra fulgida TaxID=60492 RepID=A0A9N8ZA42_9GLOM|nr:1104_t:CDS:10 [Racocetra fulgida]
MSKRFKEYIQLNEYVGKFNPSNSLFYALRPKKLFQTILIGGLFTILLILYDIHSVPNQYDIHSVPNQYAQHSVGISQESYNYGVNKCNMINRAKPNNKFERTSNPRFVPGTKTIILKNGKILTGKGDCILGDIILKNGLIHDIGPNLNDEDATIIDPEIISSHAGVISWPYLTATVDMNEDSNPITSFVILPGSSNLMGGEGFVIKMRPVDTLSVDDMGIYANIDPEKERVWRWLKMACGENIKWTYAILTGRMPFTRMGEAWLFRKHFAEAQALKQRQDDWCEAASKLGITGQLNSYFPEELRLDSLVALLRGDARLNVHCYETYDIEAIIRHSLEFNFNITALHHALDAYRIPDIIKKRVKNNITVATFSDLWGFKKETFQASTKAPKILADAHIPVALKSDHPAINAQALMFEASKAHYYGLDEHLSLAAVTSVPAKALGLDHRIGQISKEYDADVVVWDSHPLELGATPLEVYIDGIPQFNTSLRVLENDISKPIPSNNRNASMSKSNFTRKSVKSRLATSIMLKNVSKIYVDGNQTIDATLSTQGDISLIVKDGIVECIGINCTQPDHISSYEVIDLNGGYVLPGFTAVAPSLGLSVFPREPTTTDGEVTPVSNPNNAEEIIYAIDGLKLGGKHLEVAHKAGVFTAVTAPLSSKGGLTGVSMAFETGANTDNIFGRAARGEIPLVVNTHSKDEIASLIRLKIQVENNGGHLNLVILGGAEAYILAAELAEHKIPVILIPLRAIPKFWTAQHVLTGAPITNTTGIDILYANGVKIGIGVAIAGLERNLIWDAGWAHINSRGLISEKDSFGFISWTLEEILGLNTRDRRLMKGNIANFIAYDGNPFDMNTRVKIVAGGGKSKILIDPEQDYSKRVKRDNQNSSLNKARRDDDNEEGIYTVENILAHRLSTNGHLQYKVKWAGYDESESCWVNATDVFAPYFVTRYWNDQKMKSSAQSSKQSVKNNQSNKEISSDIKDNQDQAQINSKRLRNKTKNNSQANISYDDTTPMCLSKVDKISNVNSNNDISSDDSNANCSFNETFDNTDEDNFMNTNSISSKSDNLNTVVEIETTSFNKNVKTDKDTTKVNDVEDDNSYIIVSEDDPLNLVEIVLDVKPIDAQLQQKNFDKDITQEPQCAHEQINFRAEKNWENYATVIDIKIDPGSGDLMCVLKW